MHITECSEYNGLSNYNKGIEICITLQEYEKGVANLVHTYT